MKPGLRARHPAAPFEPPSRQWYRTPDHYPLACVFVPLFPNPQAAAVIAESNLDVVPHWVGARVAFMHSLTSGLGVVEHEPEGKAATEIRKLLTWVWERIGQ